jgi:hypothetical protein
MTKALFENVNQSIVQELPWSATLSQIRKNYGTAHKESLTEIARSIAKKTDAIVFLVFDLASQKTLEYPADLQSVKIPKLDEMTLYVIPAKLIWLDDGEVYRNCKSTVQIEGIQFRLVYVCYRNLEAKTENAEYTRFIELHFK